jgi:hypothetical protein
VSANDCSWLKYIPNFLRQYIPGLSCEKETMVFGPASYKDVTLSSLEVIGPASLVDVKVEGHTNIQGPLEARDSKLNNLEVNGPVALQGTTITGQTMINGPLLLDKKSTVEDISIATNDMTIKDSMVNNIFVRKTDDKSKKQLITLEGAAHVKGTIKFEQEGGQVIMRDSAKVDGLISGGESARSDHKK